MCLFILDNTVKLGRDTLAIKNRNHGDILILWYNLDRSYIVTSEVHTFQLLIAAQGNAEALKGQQLT